MDSSRERERTQEGEEKKPLKLKDTKAIFHGQRYQEPTQRPISGRSRSPSLLKEISTRYHAPKSYTRLMWEVPEAPSPEILRRPSEDVEVIDLTEDTGDCCEQQVNLDEDDKTSQPMTKNRKLSNEKEETTMEKSLNNIAEHSVLPTENFDKDADTRAEKTGESTDPEDANDSEDDEVQIYIPDIIFVEEIINLTGGTDSCESGTPSPINEEENCANEGRLATENGDP